MCFISSTNEPCGSTNEPTDSFDIAFIPISDGVHKIHSSHFLSNTMFDLEVSKPAGDGISSLYSSATFMNKRTGEEISEIQIGLELEIKLDLRSHKNLSLETECDLHSNSYYTVKG